MFVGVSAETEFMSSDLLYLLSFFMDHLDASSKDQKMWFRSPRSKSQRTERF